MMNWFLHLAQFKQHQVRSMSAALLALTFDADFRQNKGKTSDKTGKTLILSTENLMALITEILLPYDTPIEYVKLYNNLLDAIQQLILGFKNDELSHAVKSTLKSAHLIANVIEKQRTDTLPPEQKMKNMMTIADQYADYPNTRISWLKSIVELNLKENFTMPAFISQLHVSALIATVIEKKNYINVVKVPEFHLLTTFPIYYSQLYNEVKKDQSIKTSLQLGVPSVSDNFKFMPDVYNEIKFDPEKLGEFKDTLLADFTPQALIDSLDQAIKLGLQAGLYYTLRPIFSLKLRLHQASRDYSSMAKDIEGLPGVLQNISTKNSPSITFNAKIYYVDDNNGYIRIYAIGPEWFRKETTRRLKDFQNSIKNPPQKEESQIKTKPPQKSESQIKSKLLQKAKTQLKIKQAQKSESQKAEPPTKNQDEAQSDGEIEERSHIFKALTTSKSSIIQNPAKSQCSDVSAPKKSIVPPTYTNNELFILAMNEQNRYSKKVVYYCPGHCSKCHGKDHVCVCELTPIDPFDPQSNTDLNEIKPFISDGFEFPTSLKRNAEGILALCGVKNDTPEINPLELQKEGEYTHYYNMFKTVPEFTENDANERKERIVVKTMKSLPHYRPCTSVVTSEIKFDNITLEDICEEDVNRTVLTLKKITEEFRIWFPFAPEQMRFASDDPMFSKDLDRLGEAVQEFSGPENLAMKNLRILLKINREKAKSYMMGVREALNEFFAVYRRVYTLNELSVKYGLIGPADLDEVNKIMKEFDLPELDEMVYNENVVDPMLVKMDYE